MLTIGTWNVRGIMSSTMSLSLFLRETNCDVVIITRAGYCGPKKRIAIYCNIKKVLQYIAIFIN